MLTPMSDDLAQHLQTAQATAALLPAAGSGHGALEDDAFDDGENVA